MSEVQIAIIDQENTQIALAVPGVQGPAGAISSGGSANQVFYKVSGTNYDAGWTFIGNANVDAAAAIAGTKISPNFGSQAILTTGTNTAASFSPTSNTIPTNGVYLPAANSVAISTGGSNRLHITSAGLVGIGTSSPAGKLHVIGDSATPGVGNINISNGAFPTSGWAFRITDSGSVIDLSLDGAVGGTFRSVMYFARDTGNVGIGTTAASAKLHVFGAGSSSNTLPGNASAVFETDANAVVAISTPSANTASLVFPRSTDAYYAGIERSGTDLNLRNNGSTRATIDSSGRLLVGTTSAPGEGQLLKVSKALSGTEGAGIDFVGGYSLANDASQTINIVHGGLLQITENTNGKAGLLFSTYNSASIVILADPSNIFATSDTAGKLCVFKSANTAAVTVKNRLGATHDIGIAKLTNA